MSTEAAFCVPLKPAVLVRSFELPVEGMSEALSHAGDTGSESEPHAAILAQWLESEGFGFGANASPAGAMVVFDVTLYSRLPTGGTHVPLLRLSQLRLQLSVVAPPQ